MTFQEAHVSPITLFPPPPPPAPIAAPQHRLCCHSGPFFLLLRSFWRHFSDISVSASTLCFIAVVQSLSHVQRFATPWTAARQASLSITNFQSLLKLMSIESMIPSNHLILCCPLLLPPSISPSIRVFSNESVLQIRWTKY